jgi:hypothetical protein
LVLDDRRPLHASAAQKQDFVSPTLHLFNARIPPINRISSHSLTTLALVELASTATVDKSCMSSTLLFHPQARSKPMMALIQASSLVATRQIVFYPWTSFNRKLAPDVCRRHGPSSEQDLARV